ncbi:MAG TPA: tripartite tricarboxylate transporter substrate binding protein [Ramlibacter sp.]|nr:tripartite tricarboxylate transporter substrate binding protein [Ramlibacter sp.]
MKLLKYLLITLGLVVGSSHAQTFPDKSRPLKIIVPSGAASTGDLLARAYGRAITEVSGLPVVVENKPGAEGVIGLQAVKSAPPDGYTIMLTSSSTQVLNAHMIPNLPYDPVADFVPLTGAGKAALVMYVGSGLPIGSAREFIEAARAHPGKHTFGSNTATGRLLGEMLEQMAGIKLLSVPFKTLPEVMTAVSAGQVDMAFATVSTADAYVKSGRVRPMAVTSGTRLPALPNVPTLREEGLRDYDLTSWLATYAPAGTPPAIAATLRDILRRASQTSAVKETLHTFSMEPLELAGDQLTALQRAESEKWRRVVRPSAQRPQ